MQAERSPAESLLLALGDVVWEHEQHDAAVVRFKTGPSALPALPLAGSAPQDLDDRAIYVIGHPLPNSDKRDIERISRRPVWRETPFARQHQGASGRRSQARCVDSGWQLGLVRR
jgi:hypothetical protein